MPDIVATASRSSHLHASSVYSTRFRLRSDANAGTLARCETAAPPSSPSSPARHCYGRTMDVPVDIPHPREAR